MELKPQIIKKNGKEEFVVLTYKDYLRLRGFGRFKKGKIRNYK